MSKYDKFRKELKNKNYVASFLTLAEMVEENDIRARNADAIWSSVIQKLPYEEYKRIIDEAETKFYNKYKNSNQLFNRFNQLFSGE